VFSRNRAIVVVVVGTQYYANFALQPFYAATQLELSKISEPSSFQQR